MPIEAGALGALGKQRPAPGNLVELGDVVLCCSGVGAERARDAACRLVNRNIVGLVSWGMAGGLDPNLRAGDLIIPTEVRSLQGQTWQCDEQWRSRLLQHIGNNVHTHSGTQIVTDAVVTTPGDKASLAQTGAFAVDMESAALAGVAEEANLPFIVLRSICDPANFTFPRKARVTLDATGRFKPGMLLRSLRHPIDLLRLLSLQRGLRAAERTLRDVARLAGPRLSLP